MESQILKTGGILKADTESIICSFSSPRLVLSTSLYNGGYLLAEAVFNHRLNIFVNSEHDLPGGSLGNYLKILANEKGLPAEASTGMLTSARMHCRGYSAAAFKEINVEVLATAGVEKNAVRAGEPAGYYEDRGQYQMLGGTINILAFTNVSIPHGAMAKALISITEAKSAVLQEMAVVSPSTLQPATGTGTDGVILASDPHSSVVCTDTGTKSKLGELFCLATKAAVRQSLELECDINARRQGTAEERLRRLGITPEHQAGLAPECYQAKLLLAMSGTIWQEYCWGLIDINEMRQFFDLLELSALQPTGSFIAAFLRQKIS